MPILPIMIDCLKRSGISTLSVDDLRLVAGIDKFIEKCADVSLSEAHTLALLLLTVNSQADNFQAIKAAYGDRMSNNVRMMSGLINAEWSIRYNELRKRLNDPDPVSTAAAALLYSDFFYYSYRNDNNSENRIQSLRSILSCDKNNNHCQCLVQLMNSVALPTVDVDKENSFNDSNNSRKSMRMISLSMDLGGSTEAKSAMVRIAGVEGDRLQELYATYYLRFLEIEDRFYSSIFQKDSQKHEPLDFSRLFLIKGIGDELWMVYHLESKDSTELKHAMSRILPAALDAASRSVCLFATEKPDNPRFDPLTEDKDLGRCELVCSPIKIHIDLIEDAYEISQPRGEFFLSKIAKYYNCDGNSERGFQTLDKRHAEVSNRLTLGVSESGLRQYRTYRRTDYIGHEIDRFFRIGKFAKPGLVTIGDSLFKEMDIASTEIIDGKTQIRLGFPFSRRNRNSFAYEKFSVYKETATGMKGVGYAYDLHHFVDPFFLLTLDNMHQQDDLSKYL
ncbi:MAG: hypothetical protein HQL83_00700 [Magnetococcales bacterium]|nr:hypothetical protein [Magnetococcales bacterium]